MTLRYAVRFASGRKQKSATTEARFDDASYGLQ